MKSPLPSEKFVDRARSSLNYWQRALGLLDWEIHLKIDYALEREKSDEELPAEARVEVVIPERRFANISISPYARLPDVEYLVCHELIHVVLSTRKVLLKTAINSMDASSVAKIMLRELWETCEEHHVEILARALINTKRKGVKKNEEITK